MDNFFINCPPMMEDQGRHLTDFNSETKKDEFIKHINNIWRDDEYRLFLQRNGKMFMDRDWEYHKKRNSCKTSDCVHQYPTRQLPDDMITERQAYDSLSNCQTYGKMKQIRQCEYFKDYRLNKD